MQLPRVDEGAGGDREGEQVGQRAEDAPATTATLAGGVDHDIRQRRAHPAGERVGEACCREGCHRSKGEA